MKIEFRLPGSAEYSYASIWTTEGSPGDNARELRDVDDDLLYKVADVLKRGCAATAISVLNPVIVTGEPDAPSWPTEQPSWNTEEAQNSAQAYQAPQTYQSAPPAWQPPQSAPQPPQQAWQAPQVAPAQAGPPGPAPMCAHGPKKWVPAGNRKSDGVAYTAFWACQAPRGMPKCKA